MSDNNELHCQELVEIITEYLEGTLPLPERTRFEEHLKSCPGCRNYLAQMRQTIHRVGQLKTESLAPATQQELLQLFRGWKKSG
ncbi:MAG: zf-HC2 domain-containing protein [Anaerolineae bacterium]